MVSSIPELVVIPMFHSMYACSMCILTYLRLDYGQISGKRRILRCGAY